MAKVPWAVLDINLRSAYCVLGMVRAILPRMLDLPIGLSRGERLEEIRVGGLIVGKIVENLFRLWGQVERYAGAVVGQLIDLVTWLRCALSFDPEDHVLVRQRLIPKQKGRLLRDQPRLLEELANDGVFVRLAGVDPSAGERTRHIAHHGDKNALGGFDNCGRTLALWTCLHSALPAAMLLVVADNGMDGVAGLVSRISRHA